MARPILPPKRDRTGASTTAQRMAEWEVRARAQNARGHKGGAGAAAAGSWRAKAPTRKRSTPPT